MEVPIGDYLASAARRGDKETLLRFHKYLDYVDSDGRNVVMSACVVRQEEVVHWSVPDRRPRGQGGRRGYLVVWCRMLATAFWTHAMLQMGVCVVVPTV